MQYCCYATIVEMVTANFMTNSELELPDLKFSWSFKLIFLNLIFAATTTDLAMITNLCLNCYSEVTMVILNLDCCCYEAVKMVITLILYFNEKGVFLATVQIILIVPHRIRVIFSFSLRFLRFLIISLPWNYPFILLLPFNIHEDINKILCCKQILQL